MSDDQNDVAVADGPAEVDPGTRKPRRSTGRRITLWIGIGMILAGLGLLAYVAWQLWGTNWVSKRQQREITSQLEQDWANGQGCDKFCPKGEASALIRIPKFGRDYVVPVLEGVTPDILAKGFGHFEESAGPGQIGNYALAGHRVTHGEPLRHMPDLRPGDKVIVETRKVTYTYVLDTDPNDLIVSFTNVWVVDPLPTNPKGGVQPKQVKGQRLITLTTCSEIFHTDNRMISFGHLVKSTPKTAG
ncbi:class E sortase [Marmoricola sp. RAF53]|uniref:class E sortase n=1 Tax=Marmoricola sp. RAF53 TaxID=3233059 RepID=UPI003F9C88F8